MLLLLLLLWLLYANLSFMYQTVTTHCIATHILELRPECLAVGSKQTIVEALNSYFFIIYVEVSLLVGSP